MTAAMLGDRTKNTFCTSNYFPQDIQNSLWFLKGDKPHTNLNLKCNGPDSRILSSGMVNDNNNIVPGNLHMNMHSSSLLFFFFAITNALQHIEIINTDTNIDITDK